MSNPRLRVLQRALKIQPGAPAAPSVPAADDLTAALQQYIDRAVQAALGNAPTPPRQGSRLAALDMKLSQLAQATPAPVNPPARPLRDIFDIPAATPAAAIPASQLIEPTTAPAGGKMPRTRVVVTGRDGNGHLATLTMSTEGQPDTTVVVNARDPNGHILGIAVNGRQGQRQFHIQRDMNGLIAGLVEG